MSIVGNLVGRSVKLFVRDKTTVFFACMSVLILIGLYFLFIAKIYVENLSGLDNSAAYFLVYSQVMAGVVVLNAFSFSVSFYGKVAEDFKRGRLSAFSLTQAKPRQILVAYVLSGFLVPVIFNLIMWILALVLMGILTGYVLPIATILLSLAVIVVVSLISSALMFLITVFVKEPAAMGAISGGGGAILGFLCGVYTPYSQLGRGVEILGSALPFSHLTIWLKIIVSSGAMTTLGITDSVTRDAILTNFSANSIGFLGINMPLSATIFISVVIVAMCFLASWVILKRRIARRVRS
ncbi:MAG: ABC transporter permease [Candidatus Nomurabacteria bacterium]|jgi:multidrug/hemolysin transport system permease protein|nr:ABC transporter permease [Candidatus Nomurabacteria bacterium]